MLLLLFIYFSSLIFCNMAVGVFNVSENLLSGFNRLDNEIFLNRNQGIPNVIKFHPYESEVAVADKDGVT